MKSKICFGLFTLFIVCFLPLYIYAQFTYCYKFKPKSKRVDIPFELRNNLIVIKITINKSDTLNFILDTGLRMNLLTDPQIANSLGLVYSRKLSIMGFGEEEPLSAMVSVNNEIDFSGVIGLRQNLVALSEDKLDLSEYVGMPIHGVLGFDLFGSFVVKIDFRSQIITLTDPAKYKYKSRHGQQLPISIEDGKPYIMASTTSLENKEIPLKLILDTGAGHGLLLEMAGNQAIQLPEKTIARQLGKGLNGTIYGQEGRIEQFKIGNYSLSSVITSFPDTNLKSSRIFKNTNRQGNMGCEVMRRFDVIFNYQKGYVVLKPNKKTFKEPFERDMSGMIVVAKGKNFEKYLVDEVYVGSPAYLAGVKSGDELLIVNYQTCSYLSLSEINQQMLKGDGKKIAMVIRRGKEILKVEMVLRRMI
ncbi:MAG: aspartyl protease family protein [Cytophagales bacterium]